VNIQIGGKGCLLLLVKRKWIFHGKCTRHSLTYAGFSVRSINLKVDLLGP